MLTLCASYSHLPFENSDAKVNGFPLPFPAEFFVDWNNAPDHTAQSFSEPEGAATISAGEYLEEVPALQDYTTTGAPETYGGRDHRIDEVRPGLYDLDLKDQRTPSKLIGEPTLQATYLQDVYTAVDECRGSADQEGCLGDIKAAMESTEKKATRDCKVVEVDMSIGDVDVFVTDPKLSDVLSVSATDEQIKVCAEAGQALPEAGSVYFYQKTR